VSARATTPEDITNAVVASFDSTADPRLREVLHSLVRHLHACARDVDLTQAEWEAAAVRPTPYPIPYDGPVGRMLAATGRHPWRPAHIHMIVSAPGYRKLTTHIFDGTSEYLDSDAVFAVKPSLVREFVPCAADDPERPDGVNGEWFTVENDLVLAPER
jgi:protocatechuate 3,4-dioxygenase beta subunit